MIARFSFHVWKSAAMPTQAQSDQLFESLDCSTRTPVRTVAVHVNPSHQQLASFQNSITVFDS